MLAPKVQLTSWSKIYQCLPTNLDLSHNDKVIIKTELGHEVGDVVGFEDVPEEPVAETAGDDVNTVLRKATLVDLEKIPNAEKKEKHLSECKLMIEKYSLPMKLVDVHFSFDGSRLTFAFIADGRIDFRDLVKDLTRQFNRTIRLQQIGIRDEAKLDGDCGHCGRPLCCRGHLKEFVSISSEMAELQQCEHRGSDRISGACGRLMCCLAYEEKGYIDMIKTMPPVGATVNVDGKKGEVIGWHLLKRTVDVKFSDDDGKGFTITEVDLDRNKKNN